MRLLSLICIAAAALASTGCANINTQSRDFAGHQAAAKTVDASHLAVFSVNQTSMKKDAVTKNWTAFCAEPSPDALVAYATSFGVSAAVAGNALDVVATQSQVTASI